MTKEGLEQQKVLKALAREIKFESVMFADVFGYSTREPLRYYLWMCELNLWLKEKTKSPVYTTFSVDTEKNQKYLISKILMHQEAGVLPKRENK
jgi:hypothetical protein